MYQNTITLKALQYLVFIYNPIFTFWVKMYSPLPKLFHLGCLDWSRDISSEYCGAFTFMCVHFIRQILIANNKKISSFFNHTTPVAWVEGGGGSGGGNIKRQAVWPKSRRRKCFFGFWKWHMFRLSPCLHQHIIKFRNSGVNRNLVHGDALPAQVWGSTDMLNCCCLERANNILGTEQWNYSWDLG